MATKVQQMYEYPPFANLLKHSVSQKTASANDKNDYCLMASCNANGSPCMNKVVLLDILASDPRILLFAGQVKNADLMAVCKVSPSHEIHVSRGDDVFILSGKINVVASHVVSSRFRPPRLIQLPDDASDPDEFWDNERLRQWKKLNQGFRSTFTWPNPGEIAKPRFSHLISTVDVGFRYLKLDAITETKTPQSSIMGAPGVAGNNGKEGARNNLGGMIGSTSGIPLSRDEELRMVHDAALDNFALLVFKITRVDHLDQSEMPPRRTLFEMSKDGTWSFSEINP
ncbi:hypothetical protein SmJEL517_g00380 [Synchytrium microbalum]|uniref:Pyridoxamine 5'-phosphate oxidase Alr4036 family FMN-binding domain-containing protein n=1 Tax=Synchytrium microbalum TaxID=1806994 RepID=A0A507CB09_9FUNG|nr:uncharacterized protein SmJEL517_g00380 [Synchytrium microbalum]TPX38247.1 hypothetical protein SmJEL517_g00380 [Synchytrium microbalum]